jgi:hypothetical protein
MSMPQTAQWIFLVANTLLCACAFLYAVRHWKRTGSAVGFLMLLAGAATVINEPVVDVLGRCWFAKQGSIGLFTAWGVTIPAFMLPVYCWYVGGQALFAYGAMQNGMTAGRLYRLYGIFALVNVALELPGLNMGIYAYYGQQPFEVLGFPLWWPICNALMPIVMAALVHVLLPYLSGYRSLLVILLGPMAAGMTNGAIGTPVWVALNSAAPPWVAYCAAVLSLVLGLTLAFLLTRVLTVAGAATGPRASAVRFNLSSL